MAGEVSKAVPLPQQISLVEAAVSVLLLVIVALAVMAALHERHYKSRAQRIIEARSSGHIEDRIACLETILAEDRLT